MKLSTTNLVLSPDAAVDLQTHTHLSDGKWTPEALIDHFISEGFALAAITDHDRVDTAARLQRLANEKNFPLLVAAEMTTTWRGQLTDILCFGFEIDSKPLLELTEDVLRRQRDNTRQVHEHLYHAGHIPEYDTGELQHIIEAPAARQVKELLALLEKHNQHKADFSPGRALYEAGFSFATNDPARVVEAAHQCGAVALIAHPGRGDGFTQFDTALLDEFRREIPIDGLEVHYPLHTGEQVAEFQAYAERHGLLSSSGSDSHSAEKPPVKYRAELVWRLLERLGVRVEP